MTEHPQNHIEAPGKPGAALIAKLERLRDSHRLGIHMWEDEEPFAFPKRTHEYFSQWDGALAHTRSAKISLSLLPAKNDGITMQPYECTTGCFGDAGYLLDLSENQTTPPSLIAGDIATMDSGYSPYNKSFPADCMDVCLDRLAANYKRDHVPFKSAKGVGSYNEVGAHVGHSNIAAIVVPWFNDDDYPTKNYDALVKLSGSLNGLACRGKGQDLPVVVYHVTGPHKGAITYLGQGKEALRAIAGEALKELSPTLRVRIIKQLPFHYSNAALFGSASRHLGIDLYQPRGEQNDAFAKLGVAGSDRGRE